MPLLFIFWNLGLVLGEIISERSDSKISLFWYFNSSRSWKGALQRYVASLAPLNHKTNFFHSSTSYSKNFVWVFLFNFQLLEFQTVFWKMMVRSYIFNVCNSMLKLPFNFQHVRKSCFCLSVDMGTIYRWHTWINIDNNGNVSKCLLKNLISQSQRVVIFWSLWKWPLPLPFKMFWFSLDLSHFSH